MGRDIMHCSYIQQLSKKHNTETHTGECPSPELTRVGDTGEIVAWAVYGGAGGSATLIGTALPPLAFLSLLEAFESSPDGAGRIRGTAVAPVDIVDGARGSRSRGLEGSECSIPNPVCVPEEGCVIRNFSLAPDGGGVSPWLLVIGMMKGSIMVSSLN